LLTSSTVKKANELLYQQLKGGMVESRLEVIVIDDCEYDILKGQS